MRGAFVKGSVWINNGWIVHVVVIVDLYLEHIVSLGPNLPVTLLLIQAKVLLTPDLGTTRFRMHVKVSQLSGCKNRLGSL